MQYPHAQGSSPQRAAPSALTAQSCRLPYARKVAERPDEGLRDEPWSPGLSAAPAPWLSGGALKAALPLDSPTWNYSLFRSTAGHCHQQLATPECKKAIPCSNSLLKLPKFSQHSLPAQSAARATAWHRRRWVTAQQLAGAGKGGAALCAAGCFWPLVSGSCRWGWGPTHRVSPSQAAQQPPPWVALLRSSLASPLASCEVITSCPP